MSNSFSKILHELVSIPVHIYFFKSICTMWIFLTKVYLVNVFVWKKNIRSFDQMRQMRLCIFSSNIYVYFYQLKMFKKNSDKFVFYFENFSTTLDTTFFFPIKLYLSLNEFLIKRRKMVCKKFKNGNIIAICISII